MRRPGSKDPVGRGHITYKKNKMKEILHIAGMNRRGDLSCFKCQSALAFSMATLKTQNSLIWKVSPGFKLYSTKIISSLPTTANLKKKRLTCVNTRQAVR